MTRDVSPKVNNLQTYTKMSKIHSYDEEKIFFYQIDRHAKTIPSDQFEDIDSVIKYLGKPVPRNHEHRDLHLARAIIVWLGQRLEEILSGVYRYTPENIVDYVENGELVHVFRLLCEKAGIECAVIEGYSKDSRYRPGDPICSTGSWNAIMADGKWHLIHPVWCIMSLEGQMNEDEIQIEVDGHPVISRDDAVDQRTILGFNEFWFCTNPVIFYLHCFPLDIAWQLQPDYYRITDVEEFCELPCLHSLFFENKLRLLSDYSCLLTSTEGKTKVVVQGEKNSAKCLDFSYTLSLLMDDDADTLELEDMPLLVFYARNNETISFEIKFPKIGIYMFRLFIDDLESDTLGFCCEFNIVCTEVNETCKKLPIDAGSIGWGYGHQAEEAGLLQASVINPKLHLKTSFGENEKNRRNEKRKIRFDLDDDLIDEMEYEAAVYVDPNDVDISITGVAAETRIDKDKGELEINVGVENEGEYALVVKAKRRDEEETKAVLNFLLQTSGSEERDDDLLLKRKIREIKSIEKRAEKIEKKRTLRDKMLVMQEELIELKRSLKEDGHSIPDEEIDENLDGLNENLELMADDLFEREREIDLKHKESNPSITEVFEVNDNNENLAELNKNLELMADDLLESERAIDLTHKASNPSITEVFEVNNNNSAKSHPEPFEDFKMNSSSGRSDKQQTTSVCVLF